MNKAASIFLRSDVTKQDVLQMIKWLETPCVTRFLNERSDMPQQLSQLYFSAPEPMLTFYLNRDGRFYVISHKDGTPAGFVKLTPEEGAPAGYELVIALGEQSDWGKGLGRAALNRTLDLAFLRWENRARRIVAKIDPDNGRSQRLFEGQGFEAVAGKGKLLSYELTGERYLKQLLSNNQAPAAGKNGNRQRRMASTVTLQSCASPSRTQVPVKV